MDNNDGCFFAANYSAIIKQPLPLSIPPFAGLGSKVIFHISIAVYNKLVVGVTLSLSKDIFVFLVPCSTFRFNSH